MAIHARAFKPHRAADDRGGDPAAPLLRRMTLSLAGRDGADLSARELNVFLTVYLDEGQHTLRGLAARFGVCKSAITRALQRLGEFGLVRREVDPRNRRGVLVHRTELGRAFLFELQRTVGRAANDAEWAAAAPRRRARRIRR